MTPTQHYQRAVWHLQRVDVASAAQSIQHMDRASYHLAQVGAHARREAASGEAVIGQHIGQSQVLVPTGS